MSPFFGHQQKNVGVDIMKHFVQLEMVTRSYPSQRRGHAYLHNSGQENSHDAKPQRKISDSTQCVSLLLQYPTVLSSLCKWPKMIFLPSQATKLMHPPSGQIQPFFLSKIKIFIQSASRSPICKRTQTSGVCSLCNVTRSTQRNSFPSFFLLGPLKMLDPLERQQAVPIELFSFLALIF